MSAIVTKKSWKKAKIWKESFAPKRTSWYAPLHEKRFEPQHGVALVVLAAFLIFGSIFSLDAALTNGIPQFSAPVVASADTNAVTANASYAIQLFHTPGAYVDESAVAPTVQTPVLPISQKEKEHLQSFTPLFVESLKETSMVVWNNSLGLTANVFVASVYEMADQAQKTVGAEASLLSF